MLLHLPAVLAFALTSSSLPFEAKMFPQITEPPNAPQKVSPIPAFEITGFQAGGIILSHRSYTNFHVLPHPNASLVFCSTLATTLSSSISSIGPTWCNRKSDSPPTSEDVWFELVLFSDAPPAPHYNTTINVTGTSTTPAADASQNGAMAKLRVVRQINNGTRDEAVHYIQPAEAPFVGTGDFFHQVYDGPENFTVTAWRYEMESIAD